MKIQKAQLAQKLNKVKSVVPKKTTHAALQGLLAKDGYLTASNMEMTVKAKIEGLTGESFIIPERAFDLINNLPDGEVEITATGENEIMIKADKIKNKYQTPDPALFSVISVQEDEGELTIAAETLLESIRRVAYAVPAQGANAIMTAMCVQAAKGKLNFAGLDGHVLAWDQVDYEGEFELLIPKNTVEKLKSIGLSGETLIKRGKTGAAFITEEFEVYTRLIEGKYFKYQEMFKELPLHTVASKSAMLEAMTRAKMCTDEKRPVRFELAGKALNLSIKDSVTDYSETVELQEEMEKALTIGFDARLVLETLKAFDCENVRLSLDSPKMPMIVEAQEGDFKAIVLPVTMR